MRCLCCIVMLVLTCAIQAQEQVLQVPIVATPQPTATRKNIQAFNQLLNEFRASPKESTDVSKLVLFFNRPEVKKDTLFARLSDVAYSQIQALNRRDISPDSLLGNLDTLQLGEKLITNAGVDCETLGAVKTILVTKNTEGNFEISLQDAADAPRGSFTIRQPNEKLFYDQLQQNLQKICSESLTDNDNAYIEKLVTGFKSRGLYQLMLEAALLVNDDDVYAGTLRIHRQVYAYIDTLKADTVDLQKKNSSTPNGDSSNRSSLLNIKSIPEVDEQLVMIGPRQGQSVSLNIEQPDHVTLNAWDYRDPTLGVTRKIGMVNRVKRDTVLFTVHHVQIQFQDGFIENIKVRGKIAGSNQLLKFENAYPIAFSTRRDFRKMHGRELLERTVFARQKWQKSKVEQVFIVLGDLLDFDQNLEIDSKNYAPENQVLDKNITDEQTTVNLKKEKTSKILDLRVFTDLKGVENENPNGLVQVELSKKLNFWNNRHDYLQNALNVGLFNYFTPSFQLSKIEEKGRRLPLNYIGSREPEQNVPNTYASTLQLLNYETFRVGAEFSVFTFDVPGIKSIISLKSGLYFGRTLTADTIRTKTDSLTFDPLDANNIIHGGVNSLQFIPEVCMQIFPDSRYGVTLAYRFNRFRALTNDLAQVSDSATYTRYIANLDGDRSGIRNYKPQKWIGTAEVYAFYRPSPTNQLFFRYRLNHLVKAPRNNFHQMQLGFVMYLSQTRKDKKETTASTAL